LPGIGDISEDAIGALGLTAGYGVALSDLAYGDLGPGGLAMTAGGTALFAADATKTSIAAITRVAAVARFIPVANKAFAAVSVIADAYNAYQAYQSCTKSGG